MFLPVLTIVMQQPSRSAVHRQTDKQNTTTVTLSRMRVESEYFFSSIILVFLTVVLLLY